MFGDFKDSLGDSESKLSIAIWCLNFEEIVQQSNTLFHTDYVYTSKPYVPKELFLGLVGDSAVGKTSICTKYMKDQFSQEYIKTTELDLYEFKKTFEETEIGMTIWDYPGSNKEQRLKSRNGWMIVVASDSRSSFDSIDAWKAQIRKTNKIEPIFLALVQKEQSEREQLVTQEMLQEKCSEDDFDEVIVLNNNEMPKEEFNAIIDHVLEKTYQKLKA